MAHHSTLPAAPHLSRLGRALAVLQVFKETLSIALLGIPLLLEVPWVALAAVPGLVLYWFHIRMAQGVVKRRLAGLLWLLTLLDEAGGVALFSRLEELSAGQLRLLYGSYQIGLLLTLTALAEIAWRRYRDRSGLRRLLRGA